MVKGQAILAIGIVVGVLLIIALFGGGIVLPGEIVIGGVVQCQMDTTSSCILHSATGTLLVGSHSFGSAEGAFPPILFDENVDITASSCEVQASWSVNNWGEGCSGSGTVSIPGTTSWIQNRLTCSISSNPEVNVFCTGTGKTVTLPMSRFSNGGDVNVGQLKVFFNVVELPEQPPESVCPNGICEAGETSINCPFDCPVAAVCGNGICETGEFESCIADCVQQPFCGDDICDVGEENTCRVDCPITVSQENFFIAWLKSISNVIRSWLGLL